MARKHVLSLKTGKIGIKKTRAVVKKKVKITSYEERVATAIPGLDEAMEGGFERESTNLIVGGAGSGKTIFGIQFLINGIERFGENGVYLTFDESKKKLYKHTEKFGWNLEKYEKEGKLAIIEFMPEQVESFLEEGGGLIEAAISKVKAKRIVIDSLTDFSMLHKGELARKEACLALFKMLQRWGCATLLIAQYEPDPDKHISSLLEFETDGVLLLYNVRKEDFRERSLEILKLRGTHHSSTIFPMRITDKGIAVFPEDSIF